MCRLLSWLFHCFSCYSVVETNQVVAGKKKDTALPSTPTIETRLYTTYNGQKSLPYVQPFKQTVSIDRDVRKRSSGSSLKFPRKKHVPVQVLKPKKRPKGRRMKRLSIGFVWPVPMILTTLLVYNQTNHRPRPRYKTRSQRQLTLWHANLKSTLTLAFSNSNVYALVDSLNRYSDNESLHTSYIIIDLLSSNTINFI